MDPLTGKIVVNGAPSQLDRWLAALAPGYAKVDGRSLAVLLGFPAEFGRLINFFDLNDRIDGDWSDFFRYDPVLAFAGLAAADMNVLAASYHDLVQRTRSAGTYEDKFALLTQTFAAVAQPARDLDDGLRALNSEMRGEAVLALRQRIAAMISDELGAPLRSLAGYAKGAGERGALGRAVPFDTAAFAPVWNVQDVSPDGSIFSGSSPRRRIDNALAALQPIFDTLSAGLGGLQATAEADLEASLASGDHKPHIALYIAFAKLFGTAQDTINTMAERYARFYYHDILREDFRGASPDSVYLAFALADDDAVTSTSVPAGTLFGAGQDKEGNDIFYGAAKGLTVTAADLADLRTLRVDKGRLFTGPVIDTGDDVEREIFSSLVSIQPATDSATAWTTFGATPPTQGGSEVTTPATLGFAVASPYLLLAGGTRDVTLRLDYVQDPAAALDDRLARLTKVTGLDAQTIFRNVLLASFTLTLSTEAGWLGIETYDIVLPPAGTTDTYFDITFELTPSAVAITAFNPDEPAPADGPNPNPLQPTLRAYLKQQPVLVGGTGLAVSVYPLSLLAPLQVTGWSIAVDVSEFTVALLGNTDGDIDASKPFPVLGAPPVVGSFLDIRSPELFAKTIATLEVLITWFALPQNDKGFYGWYADYTIGLDGTVPVVPNPLFDNTTFRVDITVVNAGTWDLNAAAGLEMFRTQVPPTQPGGQTTCQTGRSSGPLCQATDFDSLTVKTATPPAYYDPAASAVRMTLSAPPYAFGDTLYPINVLACVIADLPTGTDDTGSSTTPTTAPATTGAPPPASSTTPPTDDPVIKYPNPPWLPQATSVTLHYTANWSSADAATAADGTYYYLMPFDGTDVAQGQDGAPPWLLPNFPCPGNLYIGLMTLLTPLTQTLLFEMAGGGAGWTKGEPPLAWEILSGNQWIALTAAQILSDGTTQLQNSGIVTLSLPRTDPNPGTVMPPTAQWLHAAATDPERHPKTNSVFANALIARCQDAEGTDRFAGPLPANTISSSVQDLAYVQTIAQPAPSFGGRPAEVGPGFQTWLGERLRHKNRAIQAWDFERLVLEAFPSVWKVQALPARTLPTPQSQGGNAPGNVLVVVVPGANSPERLDPTAPMASADTLSQIGQGLEAIVSPFVTATVTNPQYVRITVTATVQFAADANSGATYQQLNDDLVAYLSPWFYDAARAAKGGDYASENEIADFIATRPYVEALISLALRHEPKRETLDWYFLTSAQQHDITPSEDGPVCDGETTPPAAAR